MEVGDIYWIDVSLISSSCTKYTSLL